MKIWLLYRDSPASEIIGAYESLPDAGGAARRMDPEMDPFRLGGKGYWESGLWRIAFMQTQRSL